jgi:hypothetical protein
VCIWYYTVLWSTPNFESTPMIARSTLATAVFSALASHFWLSKKANLSV